MQISHTRAQRLIQFNVDQSLSHQDKEILQAHLDSCPDCRRYADSLWEMEGILLPVMRSHWNLSPAPLSLAALGVGKSKIPTGNYPLATRTALIGLICMVFLFSIWQVTFSNGNTPGLFTSAIPLIPTPSAQYTLTTAAQKNCGEQSYTVQGDDTLERIAQKFASSKEEIMTANKLKTEALRSGVTIWIPVCTLTPTGTLNALTTTYTPSIKPTTSTPGG